MLRDTLPTFLGTLSARFNTQEVGTRTVNLAGGEAFTEGPELEFASLILTSFVKDQFYRSANVGLSRVTDLIAELPDKKFAAQAAVYARREHGLRSISHVVAAEIAHVVKGEPWVRQFLRRVVRRPDDMTEILSYYMARYGKPLPNSLKRGLADAFRQFNAYQLAKYRASRKGVSLVDAVNLVHPKPTDDNAEALHALVEGTLRSEDTWESELTRAGQQAENEDELAELKHDAWAKLIAERKLGYFALLRNLRNLTQQAPDLIPAACEMLVDEKLIRSSLVLPFRYRSAMDAFDVPPPVPLIHALNRAVDISLQNVPELPGKTLVALDGSGSMTGRPIQIGALFAAVLVKRLEADCLTFSNDARYVLLNPADSTLTITAQLEASVESAGTNFHAIFQRAERTYDRIIILSDMQAWIGYNAPTASLAEYKQRNAADPHIYSFDLQGYGTLQFPERHVYCLAGFSEKVFDVMALLEQDKQALVHTIRATAL